MAKALRSQNSGHSPGITKAVPFFLCRINYSGYRWDDGIEKSFNDGLVQCHVTRGIAGA